MVMGWDDALIAGTSILSSVLGNSAAKKQAKLDKEKLALQKQQVADAKELSDELMRRGIATQVDALGNVTAYDQATNTWKSVLAPKQQKIQDLSDAEQTQQLGIDAPVNRAEGLLNAITRNKERGVAAQALNRYDDVQRNPVRGSDIASQLRLGRETAVNKGFADIGGQLATSALRSGAAGFEGIAGALAKQKAMTIAQTMGNPSLEGMQIGDEMQANRSTNALNEYSTLASRAAGAPQVSFNPTSVGTSLSSALANSRSAAAQGGQGALSGLSLASSGVNNLITPTQPPSVLDDLLQTLTQTLVTNKNKPKNKTASADYEMWVP